MLDCSTCLGQDYHAPHAHKTETFPLRLREDNMHSTPTPTTNAPQACTVVLSGSRFPSARPFLLSCLQLRMMTAPLSRPEAQPSNNPTKRINVKNTSQMDLSSFHSSLNFELRNLRSAALMSGNPQDSQPPIVSLDPTHYLLTLTKRLLVQAVEFRKKATEIATTAGWKECQGLDGRIPQEDMVFRSPHH